MENSVFPARTAVFDPYLGAYKSDEETFSGLEAKSLWFFTSGGKFFSWKPYYFILCFWAEVQSHFLLPKGQEF